MEPIRTYSHRKIRYGLDRGNRSANIILKNLGLKEGYSHEELQVKIRQDLNGKFDVVYSDTLTDGRKAIPALVKLKTSNRKDGGIIRLNRQFPPNILREALFHEYAHIKDEKLPIFTTDRHELNSKVFWDEFHSELIEFLADMVAYALMMPPAQIKSNLWTNAYNVDEILRIYNNIEKSSVLSWIALNSHFPCHFVSIVYKKDEHGNKIQRSVYENSFYDNEIDPSLFDIESVLANTESAASVALRTSDIANRASTINTTEYHCYAYYESNLPQVVVNNIFPKFEPGIYDRLLFIGWRKSNYDLVQNALGQKVSGV